LRKRSTMEEVLQQLQQPLLRREENARILLNPTSVRSMKDLTMKLNPIWVVMEKLRKVRKARKRRAS
jgi:hypothetical protein